MPLEDFSTRDPGSQPLSDDAEELAEMRERFEDAAWDPFEETPMPTSTARGAAPKPDSPGPVRSFLEHQLRARPLPTLLAAVAAGWIMGKLLR